MFLSDKYNVYLYTYVMIYKYLLPVIYLMMCNGFVFGVVDYPLSMWYLIPSIYFLFPLGEKVLAIIGFAATFVLFYVA